MTSGKDKSNTYKSDGWVARTREQQRRRVGKIEERHLSLSLSLSLSLCLCLSLSMWVEFG